MINNIYSSVLKLISDLKTLYSIESNISFVNNNRDDIYFLKCNDNKYIDFYLCLSREIDSPRIELQIANPFSENQKDYLIIGEFYDLTKEHVDNIAKIILAILSNKVKIKQYILNEKIIKEDYSYGYFQNNIKTIKSETFKKRMFIFPWNEKFIIKKNYEFESWIVTDFTIFT